jgi:hypothetical protein
VLRVGFAWPVERALIARAELVRDDARARFAELVREDARARFAELVRDCELTRAVLGRLLLRERAFVLSCAAAGPANPSSNVTLRLQTRVL